MWLRGADPGLGINRLPVQNQIQAPSPSPATPHQWQTQQPFHYWQRLFHRLHCPTLQQPAFLLNADLKIWLENSSQDQKGHKEKKYPPPQTPDLHWKPHLKTSITSYSPVTGLDALYLSNMSVRAAPESVSWLLGDSDDMTGFMGEGPTLGGWEEVGARKAKGEVKALLPWVRFKHTGVVLGPLRRGLGVVLLLWPCVTAPFTMNNNSNTTFYLHSTRPCFKNELQAQYRVAAHNNYEINSNTRNSCKIQLLSSQKERRKKFCRYRHTNTHMSILNIQSLINTQLKMGKNNTRACLRDTCYYKTVGMERCLVLNSQSATHSKTILVKSQVNVCLTVRATPHVLGWRIAKKGKKKRRSGDSLTNGKN